MYLIQCDISTIKHKPSGSLWHFNDETKTMFSSVTCCPWHTVRRPSCLSSNIHGPSGPLWHTLTMTHGRYLAMCDTLTTVPWNNMLWHTDTSPLSWPQETVHVITWPWWLRDTFTQHAAPNSHPRSPLDSVFADSSYWFSQWVYQSALSCLMQVRGALKTTTWA